MSARGTVDRVDPVGRRPRRPCRAPGSAASSTRPAARPAAVARAAATAWSASRGGGLGVDAPRWRRSRSTRRGPPGARPRPRCRRPPSRAGRRGGAPPGSGFARPAPRRGWRPGAGPRSARRSALGERVGVDRVAGGAHAGHPNLARPTLSGGSRWGASAFKGCRSARLEPGGPIDVVDHRHVLDGVLGRREHRGVPPVTAVGEGP